MVSNTTDGAKANLSMDLVKRRLLSGGAWALGGRVALVLIGIVTNALLARLLTPAELGAYFLAYSVVGMCTALGALGLTHTVVRFVAESVGLEQYDRARRAVRLSLGFGLLGSLAVSLVYLLFGGTLVSSLFDSPALAAVAGVTAGWIVFAIVQGILVETFRGLHDIRMTVLLGGLASGNGLLTGGLLSLLLFMLFLHSGETGLNTVMLLAVLSSATSVLLAGLLLRRRIARLPTDHSGSKLRASQVTRVAWPLMVTSLAMGAVTYADLWIVGAFLSQEQVAVYGAAARLMLFVYMPAQIVGLVVPPMIAEMYAQGRRRDLETTLRAAATFAGLPSFLVLVAFVVGGGPIISFVFGDYYREGALILAVLSLGRLAQVWSGACEQTLMMTGHQVTMMSLTLLGGALIVVGAVLTVQAYGALGVAGAAAAGLAIQNVLMVLFVRARVGVWTHISFSRIFSLGARP
jgi:O-antigen/teichoic acid export membrane protein